MPTLRKYNEQESERLFGSCERLLNAKKRTDNDLAFTVLQIIAVEARSALYDAIDDNCPAPTKKQG